MLQFANDAPGLRGMHQRMLKGSSSRRIPHATIYILCSAFLSHRLQHILTSHSIHQDFLRVDPSLRKEVLIHDFSGSDVVGDRSCKTVEGKRM